MIIMYKPFVFDLPNGKYDFLDKIDPNNEKNILSLIKPDWIK